MWFRQGRTALSMAGENQWEALTRFLEGGEVGMTTAPRNGPITTSRWAEDGVICRAKVPMGSFGQIPPVPPMLLRQQS
jgi:hypothetical protein